MPCIVSTCRGGDGAFRLFPRSSLLSNRWLDAIDFATGSAIDRSINLSQKEICDWHFPAQSPEQTRYEEPSLFNDRFGDLVEISSCRLCLEFHSLSAMVPKHVILAESEATSVVFDGLKSLFEENDFLDLVCLSCIARIDVLNSIQAFFTSSEIRFQKLAKQSMRTSNEIHSVVKLEDPSVDAMIEEETVDSPVDYAECIMGDSSDEWKPESKPTVFHKTKKPSGLRTKLKRGRPPKEKKKSERVAIIKTLNVKCYICVQKFPNSNALTSHLTEDHAGRTEYRCEECDLDFPHVATFNRHLSRHDVHERPYKCSHCPLRYSSVLQLKIHENKIHGQNHDVKDHTERISDNMCDTCGKTFRFKSKLTTHIRTAHNKIDIPTCNICNKTFTAKSSLERHMLLHTNEKPHTCEECGKNFRRLLDFRHHKKMVHEGENPHVCPECKQAFNSYHTLYNHKKYVHLQKLPPGVPFKPYHLICQLCKVNCKRSSELTEHISADHPNVEYPYAKCNDCPRTFLSRQHLAAHKPIHTDKYACVICAQRHASIQRLQIHMESRHSDVAKYDCPMCLKAYKTSQALQRHLSEHKKGKTFQCDYCEKMFMRKDQKVIHERIHTGEKPFQCVGCKKRFSDDGTFCKHKKRCQAIAVAVQENIEMIEDVLEEDFKDEY